MAQFICWTWNAGREKVESGPGAVAMGLGSGGLPAAFAFALGQNPAESGRVETWRGARRIGE